MNTDFWVDFGWAASICKMNWMHFSLRAAAVYNVLCGALVVLFPNWIFERMAMPLPNYPEMWQCVGMIVGVYGIGYWIAGNNPLVQWPIVLVGFLGKIFGFIGFLKVAFNRALPWGFGWINVTNDLLWWIPFDIILWNARRHHAFTRP